MIKKYLSFIISFLFCILLYSNILTADLVWEKNIVEEDSSISYISGASIAIDQNNIPHITYDVRDLHENYYLKYAYWTGTYWNIQTINSYGHPGWSSLALDTFGYPHISYYDEQNDKLRYTYWTGSSWSFPEEICSTYYGHESSIALDSNNYPHICYTDHIQNGLMYTSKTGSSWTAEKVTTSTPQFFSLALDQNNKPHISYGASGILKYAKKTGSIWAIQNVDSDGSVGDYNSLALDYNDNPHISYHKNPYEDVRYAHYNGTSWSVELVDSVGDVGYETSIAVDSNGNPYICYHDNPTTELKCAFKKVGKWTVQTIDSGGAVGGSCKIKIGLNDKPRIVYASSLSKLMYAVQISATKPSAPRNLIATGYNGYIDLNWDSPELDGGSTVTNYMVERYNITGAMQWGTTVYNTLTYRDLEIEEGVVYKYTVRAGNVVGRGPTSNQVSASSIIQRSVSLITPNGGEKWYKNLTQIISWSSLKAGDYVKIILFNNEGFVGNITENTSNNGIYDWVIPSNLVSDSVYKVRIISNSFADVFGESNNYFSIEDKPSISLLTTEQTKYVGENYLIQWTYSGKVDNVKIDLYRSGSFIETLESDTSNLGNYEWVIPNNIEPGNYEIRVSSVSDSFAYSSGFLTIEEKTILMKIQDNFMLVIIIAAILISVIIGIVVFYRKKKSQT